MLKKGNIINALNLQLQRVVSRSFSRTVPASFSLKRRPNFSSIDEPQDHLFVPRKDPSDPSSLLRSDVRTLGTLLGRSIKSQSPNTFEKVEGLRKLTKQWRECRLGPIGENITNNNLNQAQEYVGSFQDEELLSVSRRCADRKDSKDKKKQRKQEAM